MARFSQLPSLEPDYSANEDVRSRVERRILSDPYLRRDWQFDDLESNYPIKPVMQLQRDEQRRLAEQDTQYKESLLRNKEADLRLREADLDLGAYESGLNRREAALDQIPIVREKLSTLDPRDPNFMNALIDIETEHPIAFENPQFIKSTIAPLIERNKRISSIRKDRTITLKDADDALSSIQKLMKSRDERIVPEFTEDEKFMLSQYAGVIDMYKAQQGYAQPATRSIAPQSQEIAPQSNEPFSFSSVEEAESASLPKGTIVYINGRKARID